MDSDGAFRTISGRDSEAAGVCSHAPNIAMTASKASGDLRIPDKCGAEIRIRSFKVAKPTERRAPKGAKAGRATLRAAVNSARGSNARPDERAIKQSQARLPR